MSLKDELNKSKTEEQMRKDEKRRQDNVDTAALNREKVDIINFIRGQLDGYEVFESITIFGYVFRLAATPVNLYIVVSNDMRNMRYSDDTPEVEERYVSIKVGWSINRFIDGLTRNDFAKDLARIVTRERIELKEKEIEIE